MGKHKVLLLGGTDRLLKKADGLDIDIVNIRSALDISPEAAQLCSMVLDVDLSDVESVTLLADRLHKEHHFQRIICHSEPLQMLAGHLSTRLGILGNSFETVRTLRDKYSLRKLLSDKGLSSVAAEIVTCRQELLDFLGKHQAAVVKPRSGGGSVGVHFVRNPDEVEVVWRWVENVGLSDMLAEEVLEGVEVSLEFFSLNGGHIPLVATTKEFGADAVELGHAVPAPLTQLQLDMANSLVVTVLDAVGVTWGPSHTEVIFTASGPELVESHSRRAGGHINELVSLVHGIDMERTAFELAAGKEWPERVPPPSTQAAAIRFLGAEPGRVTHIHGIADVAAHPNVAEVEIYVSPGDLSHGLRWSGDYAGHVITRGKSVAEAMHHAHENASRIRIETEDSHLNSSPIAEIATEEEHTAFDAFDASLD